MKPKFKQKQFTEAVVEKMFNQMAVEKRRIGVREFAKQIGVSAATFSRVSNGKAPDIETFFRLCFWMKCSCSEFYNSNSETLLGAYPYPQTIPTI